MGTAPVVQLFVPEQKRKGGEVWGRGGGRRDGGAAGVLTAAHAHPGGSPRGAASPAE